MSACQKDALPSHEQRLWALPTPEQCAGTDRPAAAPGQPPLHGRGLVLCKLPSASAAPPIISPGQFPQHLICQGARTISGVVIISAVKSNVTVVCNITPIRASRSGSRLQANVLCLLSAPSASCAHLCWEMEYFKSFSSSMRSL